MSPLREVGQSSREVIPEVKPPLGLRLFHAPEQDLEHLQKKIKTALMEKLMMIRKYLLPVSPLVDNPLNKEQTVNQYLDQDSGFETEVDQELEQ